MKRYREAAARVFPSRFLPFFTLIQKKPVGMNLFELTRALVDIESTTGHEKNVGDYLFAHLSALALQCGLALFIAGRAASIQMGIHMARSAVDSGRADEWLRRLRQFAVDSQ